MEELCVRLDENTVKKVVRAFRNSAKKTSRSWFLEDT
ncbi:hypothetical protein Golax_001929 [Gossypium laxum]|uniref:Uncharacterized protein n=1 Tax=Gossypium laxum TaxID=34288 RepID=A0A7J9ARL6_9ROSI|nr:hypothetical protein [Gossypium laxum]